MKLSIFDVITQRYRAAHPHALALGGSDFVPDSFASHLTFELSEGEQNIQSQSSHRSGGIELLGDRYKRDTAGIESFHDLGKVRQAASEAIDFIDHSPKPTDAAALTSMPITGKFQRDPLHLIAHRQIRVANRGRRLLS
jgi:hypothetical protein